MVSAEPLFAGGFRCGQLLRRSDLGSVTRMRHQFIFRIAVLYDRPFRKGPVVFEPVPFDIAVHFLAERPVGKSRFELEFGRFQQIDVRRNFAKAIAARSGTVPFHGNFGQSGFHRGYRRRGRIQRRQIGFQVVFERRFGLAVLFFLFGLLFLLLGHSAEMNPFYIEFNPRFVSEIDPQTVTGFPHANFTSDSLTLAFQVFQVCEAGIPSTFTERSSDTPEEGVEAKNSCKNEISLSQRY